MFKKIKESLVNRCKDTARATMKKIDMDVELMNLLKFEQYAKIVNTILMIVAIIVLMFNSIIGICLISYVIGNSLVAYIGITGLMEDESEKTGIRIEKG